MPIKINRIVPIGECFSYAVKYAAREGDVVVHGEVLYPQNLIKIMPHLQGRRYAHGWVEKDGFVYDWQNTYLGSDSPTVETFYAERDPIRIHRYPDNEALRIAIRTGNWGPWTQAEREGRSPKRKKRKR